MPGGSRALLSRRRPAQGDGGLARVDAEGEGLLEVEPDRVGVVGEVADGDVLAEEELEVAAAGGEEEGAFQGGGPDDVAVEEAGQVVVDGVAVVAGLVDGGEGGRAEQQGVRAADAGQPQGREGPADCLGVLADVFGEPDRGVAGGGPDAVDGGGAVALEDGPVLGEGEVRAASLTGCQSESREPRSTSSTASRRTVKGTRSSTTGWAARACARTPSAGGSMPVRWPVPTAASVLPPEPFRSTTRRPAMCSLKVWRASSSISSHAAAETGARSRWRLFMCGVLFGRSA